jgi:hypothetical protein
VLAVAGRSRRSRPTASRSSTSRPTARRAAAGRRGIARSTGSRPLGWTIWDRSSMPGST